MNFVNMQKKTRQEQQLERLIRLRSDSELAIFDEVQVARDEVEEAKQEVENLREYVDNHLIGPQGEQGIKGDKGDRGEKGDKGDKGKDGRDGRDGRDGMDGIDGQDGENGKDGKDGSPDTAEQIVSKLQTVKSQWLDAKAIKNLPQPVINNYQSFIGRGGGASVGLETIKSSGTIVKQGASTLEFDSTFSVTPTVNGAIISAIGDGTGDVHGPASSTDEAIARFDGTTGKIIQDYTSGAPTISDTGAVTIPLTTGNSLVVDTDTFVVDATNNRVGIGISTPANPLQVNSGSSILFAAANGTITLGTTSTSNSPSIAVNVSVNGTARTLRFRNPTTIATEGFEFYNTNTPLSLMMIQQNGLIGLGTSLPTHTLTLPSTSTGIALYNTADQTTNYERCLISWVANVLTIGNGAGGTGTQRNMSIGTNSRKISIVDSAGTSGFYQFTAASGNATWTSMGITGNGSAASGVVTGLKIFPTHAQSGTAGYNALLIDVTETSTGSGAKALVRAQVGSVDKFVVDNAGNTTATTFNPATKQTYNITNVTTDRAYDANATTLDEVADTLGTLIADLRAIGLVS